MLRGFTRAGQRHRQSRFFYGDVMEHLNELAGKIRRLYKENQAEWLQLADQGLEREAKTKGVFRFVPKRTLDLPGMVIRLSALHDAVLKSSSPVLEFHDWIDSVNDRVDPKAGCYYFVVLEAVDRLTQDNIVQLEAWHDDIAGYFDKKVKGNHNDTVASLTENERKVLRYLNQNPTLKQYQADIESGTEISRNTVSGILGKLHEMGLVDKQKRGVCNTQKGLDYLK